MKIDPDKIRFFYLRDAKKFPVACVATSVVTTPGGQYIAFSVATHNPADDYDKQYGRLLAKSRLISQECMVVAADAGAKTRVIERIAENPYLPARTRSAASGWLLWKERRWHPASRLPLLPRFILRALYSSLFSLSVIMPLATWRFRDPGPPPAAQIVPHVLAHGELYFGCLQQPLYRVDKVPVPGAYPSQDGTYALPTFVPCEGPVSIREY